MNYEVIDGMAVYGGDIILGSAGDLDSAVKDSGIKDSPVIPGLARRDVSAVPYRDRLWTDGIIPYVIDSSVSGQRKTTVDWAIDLWHSQTVIRLVPRTTQSDYVRFTRGSPPCRAFLGRQGGEQLIIIGNCGGFGIAHEIGHAVGLNHPHARVDRDEFIMFTPDSGFDALSQVEPAVTPATGPYDYRSVMHWPYRYFETIPPGMPHTSRYPDYLSAGDIDGVARLYGKPQTATTISTNPAGLEIIVDGERYRAPARFEWATGTTHVLEAPLRQGPQGGLQYVFGRWTDGGEHRHTVTADPGTTWYQASFMRMVQPQFGLVYSDGGALRTVKAGSDGIAISAEVGSARVVDLESPDGYFVERTPIEVFADPAPGTSYRIVGWRTGQQRRVLAASPRMVGPAIHGQIYPIFAQGPLFVIDWNAPDLSLTAGPPSSWDAWWQVYSPPAVIDASLHSSLKLKLWNEARSSTSNYKFQEWSDGGTDELLEDQFVRERTIEIPRTGGELRYSYKKEYHLSTFVLPDRRYGSVNRSPSPGDSGFYEEGTTVHVTASPPQNFLRWSGDASGTSPELSVVLDRPRTLNAIFSPGVPEEFLTLHPRALSFVTHEGATGGIGKLSLTNESRGPLPFQIHPEEGWMTINPDQGVLSAGETREITVTVSNTGLVPGEHHGEITVSASPGEGGGSNEALQLAIYHVTLETQSQIVELPTNVDVKLTQFWDGIWRVGTDVVASGYRHVHDGTEYILDVLGGRWKRSFDRYLIRSAAGNSGRADGIRAVEAGLDPPVGVAVDPNGNVYVANLENDRIRKIDTTGIITSATTGIITSVAGTGWSGYGGDGGLLAGPRKLAADAVGNVYIAEETNDRILKIDASGIITSVAGTGARGYGGDGGPAAEALLADPYAVATDPAGNVYVADTGNSRIRKIDALGIITTLAGTGVWGYGGDGGPAAEALLANPRGLAADGAGNVYVADTGNRRIRKIDASGIITTLAGNGARGYGGDGGSAAQARLADPWGVATDPAGNVYIADTGNQRIRKVDASGTITTLAGIGNRGWGYGGDGGPATQALFANPLGVAADAVGNVYIADAWNQRIRKIDASEIITTLAGSGGYLRDGGSVASDSVNLSPHGAALDSAGNLFFLDGSYYSSQLFKLDLTGTVSRVTGEGFYEVEGMAADAASNVYIAHAGRNRILKIDVNGVVTTLAGDGGRGYGGDGGSATDAQLSLPRGRIDFASLVAADAAGNVYVADVWNNRIRKIDVDGIITTLAGNGGNGAQGWGGDGGPATEVELGQLRGVAADNRGNVYVIQTLQDDLGHVRKIDASGVITTVATARSFRGLPSALAVDESENLYVGVEHTGGGSRVFKFSPQDGDIETIAGTGEPGFNGEGMPAGSARLASVSGIAVDAVGNVWITESGNRLIRVLEPNPDSP